MKHFLAGVAAAFLLGMLTASVPAAASSAARTGVINYYETPCQTAARVKYGVPLFNEAFIAWQRSHLGTAAGTAYNKAAAACPRPAKWDWDSMVLVGTETAGR